MRTSYTPGRCCLCGEQAHVTSLISEPETYKACKRCLWAFDACLDLIRFGTFSREETEYQAMLRIVHANRGLTSPVLVMIAEEEEIIEAMKTARWICDQFWHLRLEQPDKKEGGGSAFPAP